MRAEAEAPCTVGNFGPGFDVFSLALERRGDRIRLQVSDEDRIQVTGAGADRIPTEWSRNSACAVLDALRERTGRPERLEVHLDKGMPPGSGLGSSASSSAATIHAFLKLHDLALRPEEALHVAGIGEAVATGTVHYDDVAAALFGGLVIVGGQGPDSVIRLRPPPLHLVVARPHVDLPTREMRRLIPDALPKADVVHNLTNVARTVHACHAQDAAMLCRALDDRISKLHRSARVPRFHEAEQAARQAGAQGFLLSGSGPAMIAAMPHEANPAPVLDALHAVFDKADVGVDVFLTRPLHEVNDPAVRLS